MSYLILEGGVLVDGSGAPPVRDSMVVIDGNRIVHAGSRSPQFDDVPARRWSLAGKTIVPGLIEAHTHASFDADMLAYVRNGITSLRFAGLDQATVDKLSRRIESGALSGPRIFSCGPMIDQPPPAYPEWSVAVSTPAEAAAVAERLIREHDLHSLILTQRVTAEVMRAVIEVAHAQRRSVIAQTWAVDGREAALLGIDELHTSSRVCASREYPRERLLSYGSIAERLALTSRLWTAVDWELTRPIMEAMIEHDVSYCGMQVITQYQAGEGIAELESDADFQTLFGTVEKTAFRDFSQRLQGGWTKEDLAFARAANEKRAEWMQRFRALGGRLIAGTDMQFGGIMLHRELRNLEALGMTRLEAIAAATGECARALHLDDRLGLIRDGRLADLVVLNRDPLKDLGALRDVVCVIKDGKVIWGEDISENSATNSLENTSTRN